MLRIIQNNSASGARRYYQASDYYIDGQEMPGVWHGRGAQMLGLRGTIERDDWEAMCEHRRPDSGEPLSVRRKDLRRVGYDFNFHVPKSVSLLYGMTGDERIMDAFKDSVRLTMRDIESEMQTRVRIGGRDTDRTSGNMVWGEFVHLTARPVDGVPDPHLHAHCFVFNTTWDPQESRWKAGQFAGIKRDAPYFEAVFHSRLAHQLEQLGISTERTKSGWEIAGIAPELIGKFSRRTSLIEQEAEARGIADPEAKAELGAKTRESKADGMLMGQLRDAWAARMSGDERTRINLVASSIGSHARTRDPLAPELAATHAAEHCFERMSVVPERTLLAEAIRHGVGQATHQDVLQSVKHRDLIHAEIDGRRMVTSRAVLEEESRMLAFARDGRGNQQPLGKGDHAFKHDMLDSDQRHAVLHVLTSRDRVTLIRGGAGTGKTTMMKEAVDGIEEGGRRVLIFAPSAQASRGVLREEEGFASADTVSRLLVDEQLQQQARGQVIWIDEAGLLGTRAMAKVFDLADRVDARVILSGDRRQHGSVDRGAALRLLETEAGLMPAELRQIKRQRDTYKEVVHALSEGRVENAFKEMDRQGWVREVSDEDRYAQLADDYIKQTRHGRRALVVSPTHREAARVTQEIRDRLRATGALTGTQREIPMLVSKNLTDAQRRDAASYEDGDVLVYHQNAAGHRKGERVLVDDHAPLPIDQAARFQAYSASSLGLAPGDLVQFTCNGSTIDGKHRLNNGATYTLKGFDRRGHLVLGNGWVVDRDYGHLTHGYTSTSHSAQGRTVDHVLIAQSADSIPASGMEQFYVSVSRGRKSVTVYTDDKESLLDAVSRADERISATDLVRGHHGRARVAVVRRGIEHELAQPVIAPEIRRDREREQLCHE